MKDASDTNASCVFYLGREELKGVQIFVYYEIA